RKHISIQMSRGVGRGLWKCWSDRRRFHPTLIRCHVRGRSPTLRLRSGQAPSKIVEAGAAAAEGGDSARGVSGTAEVVPFPVALFPVVSRTDRGGQDRAGNRDASTVVGLCACAKTNPRSA